ncbi:MAG TPA: hypothetical protein VME42_11520 [Steroidobacteraceae bacterium]|nr:hypothetical protein [Steroidobacteraceae bacterium]
MELGHRTVLLAASALLLLSGCDFSSPWGSSSAGSEYGATSVSSNTGGGTTGGGSGGGTTAPPGGVGGEGGVNGTDDTVLASSSTSSVSVAVGASQTISISFNSSDGLPITGFGISGSLGTLPAGWSGPAAFTCPLVSSGSGCVLNLTYMPSASDSGTLSLSYIYVDNAGLSKVPGGTINIAYQAIAANNVVATAYPTGQINAGVGSGMQSVSVGFTTDTGGATLDAAATDLTVTTDLTTLPAGWSSAASSFSCAIVSSGNGCQLMLTYAPAAAGGGTLTLGYTYTDDTGASRMGSLNIPYSNAPANTVVGTASPAGQITAAIKGGSQAVAIGFDTDDGKPASNLFVTSSLSALPSGWHSAAGSLNCSSVSTGNGCQLDLTYTPTALGGGTLVLEYAYQDDAGTARTGTLDLPYEATTNDSVTATPSPSGQINAVVGMGTQNVSVVFTTDDGRLATAFAITSDLAALAAGWTSTSGSLACASLSSGAACQLELTYNPPAAAAGTLTLDYSYKNNANETKTGTLNIPYRATTNDTIAGTPSQSSVAVLTGSSTAVTVTFATDDANPASDLSITSGLSALPGGWSGPATFSCATVSDGSVCQLPLTYAPTVVGSGTLALGFSYLNDAGLAKTGTVSVAYRANSNDTVGATVLPSPLTVAVATSQSVTVTFATSDGNPATALSVSSGLTGLPPGWSGPATFSCASVSNGTLCQLTLTYLPPGAASGTLQLVYGYTNNAGTVMQGTVSIPYSAS